MKQYTFKAPEKLWQRAKQAARIASVEQGEDVSVSDLIRRGLREQCERIETGG